MLRYLSVKPMLCSVFTFKCFFPQAIVNAKTPIVRVQDSFSGIKCDLNTATTMGVMNSAYVRFCADFDPLARNFIMIVKVFAKEHNLSGSGRGDHFSSYSIVLLAIFFLQKQTILHSLSVLQNVPGLQSAEDGDKWIQLFYLH